MDETEFGLGRANGSDRIWLGSGSLIRIQVLNLYGPQLPRIESCFVCLQNQLSTSIASKRKRISFIHSDSQRRNSDSLPSLALSRLSLQHTKHLYGEEDLYEENPFIIITINVEVVVGICFRSESSGTTTAVQSFGFFGISAL